MILSLEKKKKDYVLETKKRTFLPVHQDVYDSVRYYAFTKNITVAQATYEVIRNGFKHMGWFK